MKYKVEFHGFNGVFKTGIYSTKKAIRAAKERYDLEYGAYLATKIFNPEGKEVPITEVGGIPCSNMHEFDKLMKGE